MDFLNNPTVKIVLTVLATANSAALVIPGVPPVVKTVCGILAAVFTALGITTVSVVNKELRGARAENLALQAKLKGGQP